MAITFIEERKRQRYLLIIFLVLIVILLGIIWKGFFQKEKEEVEFPGASSTSSMIEINFKILESEKLNELEPFPFIPSIEEEALSTGEEIKIGRENPFIPYELTTTSSKETR